MEQKSLHGLVREAARVHPHRVAVIFDSGSDKDYTSLTYRQLISQADALTTLLHHHQLRRHVIGLYCESAVNLASWILGILQVPAAYLPLDPQAPARLSLSNMQQSSVTHILIQSSLLQRFHKDFSGLCHWQINGLWQSQDLSLARMHLDIGMSPSVPSPPELVTPSPTGPVAPSVPSPTGPVIPCVLRHTGPVTPSVPSPIGSVAPSVPSPTGSVAPSVPSPTDPVAPSVPSPTDPVAPSVPSPTDPVIPSAPSLTGSVAPSFPSPTDPVPPSVPSPTGSVPPSVSSPTGSVAPSVPSPTGSVAPSFPSPTDPVPPSVPSPTGSVTPSVPSPTDPVAPSVPSPTDPVIPSAPSLTGSVAPSFPRPTDPVPPSVPSPTDPVIPSAPSLTGSVAPSFPRPTDPVPPSVPSPTGSVPPSVSSPTGSVAPSVPSPTGSVPPSVSSPTGSVAPSVPSPTGSVAPSVPSPTDPVIPSVPSPTGSVTPSIPSPTDPVAPSVPSPTDPVAPSVPSPTDPVAPSVPSPTDPVAPSVPSPTDPVAPSVPSPTGSVAPSPSVFLASHCLHELAYVLHTSGTTGWPKVVRVPHKCIVPNILHLRSLFQMSPDDVMFMASPLTFDPSVVEMFVALSSGSCLLIIPTLVKKDPNKLVSLLFMRHRTTVIQATPTLLYRFGRRVLRETVLSNDSPLRVLALGGEACPSLDTLISWKQDGNLTRILNLYGITELSCWACSYEIPPVWLRTSAGLKDIRVPLGTPLMDTHVEVRDEDGNLLSAGEGQVFVGGEHRLCLLGDELSVPTNTMRATGDWVELQNSQMYYVGRRDRLIKRNGQRVHLQQVQSVLERLPIVEVCALMLHEEKLIAFVVLSSSNGKPISSLKEDHTILHQLHQLLPRHATPDAIVPVPTLPLTPHGKVHEEQLLKMYESHKTRRVISPPDKYLLTEKLQLIWKDVLGLSQDFVISNSDQFLLSGGDSLLCVRFCEDITATVGFTMPRLMEVVLSGTFSDVINHVATSPSACVAALISPADTSPPAKRRPLGLTPPETSKRPYVTSRMGDYMVLTRASSLPLWSNTFDGCHGEAQSSPALVKLQVRWTVNTGRCVDASPLLLITRSDQLVSNQTCLSTVYIGSHSHKIQAIDFPTGKLRWERVLGGRIESSATVTKGGNLIAVGCYDGQVYFLHTDSGEPFWLYSTGDVVKSSPAVDLLTGHVVVGSHDGHVYALSPENRRCVWKYRCGSAVFSSPCLHLNFRQLYVGTLGGKFIALNTDTGAPLWVKQREVPFFSSPSCSARCVCIGSVDGCLYAFTHGGEMLWQFCTGGPVFSSPCIMSTSLGSDKLVCGSHDGRVYCVSCSDGALVWSFQTPGKVFSSPFIFSGLAWGCGDLVTVASTDGTLWVLDGAKGSLKGSLVLPGEIFSSPVVYERSLVVGCRNDFVFCVDVV